MSLTPPLPEQTEATRRVLIVDDDPVVGSELELPLRKNYNISVDVAFDVSSASELIEMNDYDLVIIDLVLPAGRGFDVLQALRRRSRSARVIVLTQYLPRYASELIEMFPEVKAALSKPLRPDDLARTVVSILGQ